MNKNIMMVISIVAVVIALGAGFVSGIKYQQMQTSTTTTSQGVGQRSFGAGRGQAGATGGQNAGNRPIVGQILSSDDKSLTIKLADGSSKIVLFDGKVTINKTDRATVADLKTGSQIAAFGTTNPDGSITATNIQLNPAGGLIGGLRRNP